MKNKVVVIGLDGATFDIINPLIAEGKLPNLNKIFNSGIKASLFSTIPPVSAPAWISFLTGKNPGKHGVLGFQHYNMSKYNCFEHGIVTSKQFAHNTIFDILTKYKKRSIAFQIPLTYPAWPIEGLMVSGYPTPDQTKAFTYPEDLSEEIGELYEYKSDQMASGSAEEKVRIYSKGLDRVSQKVEKLLTNEDYDLFVYVNNLTDWVQHKFWKYQFNNNGCEKNDYIDYFYIKLDEKIGNIINLLDEDTTLLLMSDHGAGARPTKFLNINYILRTKNLLTPKSNKVSIFTKTTKYWFEWVKEYFPMRYWTKARFSESFREMVLNTRVYKNNINWKETKAYRVPLAYPYTGININLEGRQEQGIVKEEDFKKLKKETFDILKEYADKYPQYIESIHYQEDIYKGKNICQTPDIIIELNENFDSGVELDELITEIPPILLKTISGYHKPQGIFGAFGKNIKHNPELQSYNIIDLAPTILYALDTPINNDIDGKLLTGIFTDEFLNKNEPRYSSDSKELDKNKKEDAHLSQEEEAEIMANLCEMGYL